MDIESTPHRLHHEPYVTLPAPWGRHQYRTPRLRLGIGALPIPAAHPHRYTEARPLAQPLAYIAGANMSAWKLSSPRVYNLRASKRQRSHGLIDYRAAPTEQTDTP
jgi:hypothetical protein